MSESTRSQHLYLAKINERHVLGVIRDQGPSSRADVVRHSGLSAPDSFEGCPIAPASPSCRGGRG